MNKNNNFEKIKENLLSYKVEGAYFVGKVLESKFGMFIIGYSDPKKDLIYYLNVATNDDEAILDISYKEITKKEFDNKIDFFKDEYGIRKVKRSCISIALDGITYGDFDRFKNFEYLKYFYDFKEEDCEFNYLTFQLANSGLNSFNVNYEEKDDKEVKKELYEKRFFQYYRYLLEEEITKDNDNKYFSMKRKKLLEEKNEIQDRKLKEYWKKKKVIEKDDKDIKEKSTKEIQENKKIYKKLRDNISIEDLNYENYLYRYKSDKNILEDDKLYNKEFGSIEDSLLIFYNYCKDDKTLTDYPFDDEANKVTEETIKDLWNLFVYREFKLFDTDYYKNLKEKLSYFTKREIDYLFINKLAYFKFDLRIITILKFENSKIVKINYEKLDILKERYLIMVEDYNKELKELYQEIVENQKNKTLTVITQDSEEESTYSKEDEDIILKLKKLIIKDRKNTGLHFFLGISLVKNRYLENEEEKLKDGEIEFLIFLKDVPKSIYTHLRLMKIYCNLYQYEDLNTIKNIITKNIEDSINDNELKAYEVIKKL